MSYLLSYGSVTAAGDTTEDLWNTLQSGRDHATQNGFLFKNRKHSSHLELLTTKIARAFSEMKTSAPSSAVKRLESRSFGVILASTKGITNDFIWAATPKALERDPLTPVLSEVLTRLELNPKRALTVSNACSSGLAAVRLAQHWLDQGCEDVLIFAGDVVSEFVTRGFSALKLLSSERPQPFGANRAGFLLGDAAAALWVTRHCDSGALPIRTVGLDSEGYAVTRPSLSGQSLRRAALAVPQILERRPDLLIAHGTGTKINDQTEDLAYSDLFAGRSAPVITASKWAIGHTLGASGAMDLILAAEVLRRGSAFPLYTTNEIDPDFKGRYLRETQSEWRRPFHSVMVSSLGFGGMHAVAVLDL